MKASGRAVACKYNLAHIFLFLFYGAKITIFLFISAGISLNLMVSLMKMACISVLAFFSVWKCISGNSFVPANGLSVHPPLFAKIKSAVDNVCCQSIIIGRCALLFAVSS